MANKVVYIILQHVPVTKFNSHQSLCWTQIAAHSSLFIVVNVHELDTGQYWRLQLAENGFSFVLFSPYTSLSYSHIADYGPFSRPFYEITQNSDRCLNLLPYSLVCLILLPFIFDQKEMHCTLRRVTTLTISNQDTMLLQPVPVPNTILCQPCSDRLLMTPRRLRTAYHAGSSRTAKIYRPGSSGSSSENV